MINNEERINELKEAQYEEIPGGKIDIYPVSKTIRIKKEQLTEPSEPGKFSPSLTLTLTKRQIDNMNNSMTYTVNGKEIKIAQPEEGFPFSDEVMNKITVSELEKDKLTLISIDNDDLTRNNKKWINIIDAIKRQFNNILTNTLFIPSKIKMEQVEKDNIVLLTVPKDQTQLMVNICNSFADTLDRNNVIPIPEDVSVYKTESKQEVIDRLKELIKDLEDQE